MSRQKWFDDECLALVRGDTKAGRGVVRVLALSEKGGQAFLPKCIRESDKAIVS